MRLPGRLHITWENDNTIKMDLDAGTHLRVTARSTTMDVPCAMAADASYTLELQNGSGTRIAGGVDAMGCPTIDQTLTNAGRYYIQLVATGDRSRPDNYNLRFDRTP